jgi:hypothetical protein
MSTTRINGDGTVDFIGKKIGTLRVEGIAARAGNERRFTVRCEQCGAQGIVAHSKLRRDSAKCQNASCGKPIRRRDLLAEQSDEAAQREKARIASELSASAARMQAETADYVLPAKQRPAAEHIVMSERERIVIRQRRAEVEAEERAEREARERPIREAEAQLQETHRKFAAMERQRFTDPKIQDVDFWHDPQLVGLEYLTVEGMTQWNIAAFKNFADSHPEFEVNDYNLGILNDYFAKHNTMMFTERQLEKAYRRMVDCGIRFDTPEPENPDVLPNGTPDNQKRPNANLSIAPSTAPEKPKAPTYQGWDEDGNPREYTDREVSRWSSEEMKRRLRLTAASGALELPRTGPGPRGRAYQ